MPISGFKKGDKVIVPSGRVATVKSVRRVSGREQVVVAYYDVTLGERTFDASALKRVQS